MRASHVRGLVQLATQAVAGATRIVEGVHQSVWTTLGFAGGEPGTTTRGLTGLVYRGIGGTTRLVGGAADAALATFEGLSAADTAHPESPRDIAWRAVLNGVLGDHLAASGNPLALPMTLHGGDAPLDPCAPHAMAGTSGRILLRIHGLCLSEIDWSARADGESDHAAAIAAAHGYDVVDLRYNTGLHVAQNGRALARLLEQLVSNWPVPVESLAILAHSMGGLVARSACHCAREESLAWLRTLQHLAFLGTPHHGAPLERAGNLVDGLLDSTRYTAPFGLLGRMRSAGITDLRHGHVIDADAHGHDRFARVGDRRAIVPLPEGVSCHAIAAATSARHSTLAERLVGDGLVPLRSALGRHHDPRRALAFAPASQWVAWRTGHLQLLRSPAVTRQLLHMLAPRTPRRASR